MDINPNLNKAMLCEIIARTRRGEIGYCLQLGFAENELAMLESLSHQEICDMADSSISFVKASIDHRAFWTLIANVREKSKERQSIARALELGASSEILRAKFGLSSSDVSSRRKVLGIKEATGRKPNANEEDEKVVWQRWTQYRNTLPQKEQHISDIISDGAFEIIMLVSEEAGVNLTEVVRLIRLGEKMQKK